ncbi:MAG: AAA family ATPase [Candidatus Sabulitectum sp.]|nr:AAA family ATPase [Candidatus Sabulitectum sp.]
MNILRFGIENYGCFRDYTEISFVSTSQKDEPSYRIHSSNVDLSYGILPVVGVFGPNASGKSSLLESLHSFRNHVKFSFQLDPDDNIPWTPWRLNKSPNAKPTTYCMDFIFNGSRYQYGFTHDSKQFHKEWLHRWPKGKIQTLFERDTQEDNPWYFGPSLKGEKVSISSNTGPNSLFLSAAAHNNHKELLAIHGILSNSIRKTSEIELSGYPLFKENDPILDPDNEELVNELLGAFDLGAVGFRPEEVPPMGLLPKALAEILKPDALESLAGKSDDESKFYRLILEREDEEGHKWSLPPYSESRGTNILLMRINDLLCLDGGILIIDEIDTSLHQEMCFAILDQFTNEATNKAHIQMLFSTHSVNLMSHLRRDEVVLVEKDLSGTSSVTCLADFKGIRSRDKLRDLYEDGRLGGVPIISTIHGLLKNNV